jgi:hypothetical protein
MPDTQESTVMEFGAKKQSAAAVPGSITAGNRLPFPRQGRDPSRPFASIFSCRSRFI